MQSGCSQRLPLQGYLYRVIRENGFLFIVALIQADAVTAFKVYGRYYFYFSLPHKFILSRAEPERSSSSERRMKIWTTLTLPSLLLVPEFSQLEGEHGLPLQLEWNRYNWGRQSVPGNVFVAGAVPLLPLPPPLF